MSRTGYSAWQTGHGAMRPARWVRCLLPAMVIAAAISTAQAQGGGLSPEQQRAFDEHITKASAYVTVQQYRDAAGEYLAAHAIDPRPAALFNAANAYWLGGDKERALDLYSKYIVEVPDGAPSELARSRFFELAEERWAAKTTDPALELYRRYLDLAPQGQHSDAARMRFFEVAEAMWQSGQRAQSLARYADYLDIASVGEHADIARRRPLDLITDLWLSGQTDAAHGQYRAFVASGLQAERSAVAIAHFLDGSNELWAQGQRERAVAYCRFIVQIIQDPLNTQVCERRIAEFEGREQAPHETETPVPSEAQPRTPAGHVRRAEMTDRTSRVHVSGVLMHLAIDRQYGSAVPQIGIGVGWDVSWGSIEIRAAGLLGGAFSGTYGGYLGGAARYELWPGRLAVSAGVGTPVFFSNGARVAVRVSSGLEWAFVRHLAVVVELGYEHMFNPEWDRMGTLWLPLVGLRGHWREVM